MTEATDRVPAHGDAEGGRDYRSHVEGYLGSLLLGEETHHGESGDARYGTAEYCALVASLAG